MKTRATTSPLGGMKEDLPTVTIQIEPVIWGPSLMKKQDFEMHIMKCLCPGPECDIKPQPIEHQFPDGWCVKNGVKQFAIEVTRYMPNQNDSHESTGQQQQKVVSLWRDRMWPKLKLLRDNHNKLKHVNVSCDFSVEEHHIKQISKNDIFSDELIRFILMFVDENLLQPLPGTNIEFVDKKSLVRIRKHSQDCIKVFCQEDWNLISTGLTRFRIWREPCCWLDWHGPDQKATFIDPQTEEFKRILDKKTAKAERYKAPDNLPIYLAIACDFTSDNRSAIFPIDGKNAMQGKLKNAFQNLNLDFSNMSFDKIYLVSVIRKEKLLLYSA